MKNAKPLVLVISPQNTAFVEQTIASLRAALGATAPEFEVQHLPDAAQAAAALSPARTPHVALIDVPELTEPARAKLKPLLHGLRDLDPACCVLLLSQALPDASETMAWLDQGATGVLQREFKPSQVAEPLQEALHRRLSAHLPRTARIPVRHKIRIQLASLEQALVAETLNVGTGGMFVRVVPQDVALGETVEFEFVVSAQISAGASSSGAEAEPLILKMDAAPATAANAGSSTARGTGFVRWVRPTAAQGLPEGIGVQFSELEPTTRRWIDAFVAAHHVRAFIPKS